MIWSQKTTDQTPWLSSGADQFRTSPLLRYLHRLYSSFRGKYTDASWGSYPASSLAGALLYIHEAVSIEESKQTTIAAAFHGRGWFPARLSSQSRADWMVKRWGCAVIWDAALMVNWVTGGAVKTGGLGARSGCAHTPIFWSLFFSVRSLTVRSLKVTLNYI